MINLTNDKLSKYENTKKYKKKYKTIGILGGMGPEATAEFYLKIIRLFQNEKDAIYDSDFPEIVILNLSLPDVVNSEVSAREIKKELIAGIKKLEFTGADFIAIPCNTVSFCIDEIRQAVSIPVLSIIEETAIEIKKQDLTRVGLLATQRTIQEGAYTKYLEGLEIIVPDKKEQKRTTNVVLNILSGKKAPSDKSYLKKLISNLKDRGAQKVILGCTDLPLLIKQEDCIDTLDVLARTTFRESTGDLK